MPRPSTGVPAIRFLLPLAALVGVTVAACDLSVDRSRSSSPTTTSAAPTPTSTSTTATTTAPTSRPLPAGGGVDLVRQPCAALTQDQAAVLGAQAAGEPIALDSDLACRWLFGTAIVAFLPSPDSDLTADPSLQRRTSPTTIGGHAARTGIQGTDAANCIVLVSLGGGQSFELMLIPNGPGPRGHALCDGLGTDVAAAVLTNLP